MARKPVDSEISTAHPLKKIVRATSKKCKTVLNRVKNCFQYQTQVKGYGLKNTRVNLALI